MMAFCGNCGSEIQEGAQFCNKCGTPVQQAQQQTSYQYQQAAPVAQPVDDVMANRGIAWLAYMGLLFLIPLFVKKDSKYCQFHVKQGVTLCAVLLIYEIIAVIIEVACVFLCVSVLNGNQSGGFGTLGLLLIMLFVLLVIEAGLIFLIVVEIIGIVNAAKGREKKLPLIGKITVLDPLMDKIYNSLNNK